jgi:hypothetical protein
MHAMQSVKTFELLFGCREISYQMKDYQVVKNESVVYLAEIIPQNLQPHAQGIFQGS